MLVISPECMNSMGEGASMPHISSLDVQANMDSSSDFLMISIWSRRNAFLPSPYKSGIFTSNIPSKQYATSSRLVVRRLDAQLILVATLALYVLRSPVRNAQSIPVIQAIEMARSPFVPSTFHD